MNPKIFLSTFVLIFLAELGDKTQLAAMARAASSESAKWTVFMAASSALVLSTLVAILVGSALTQVVPERYIRLTAGILFVLFGVLIIRETLFAVPAEGIVTEPRGLSSLVLRQAARLEQAAFEDYRGMAGQVTNPRLKSLLEEIASEEEQHFQKILAHGQAHTSSGITAVEVDALQEQQALMPDVSDSDRPILEHAIEHEQAAADFYAELARLTPIRSLKRAFSALSQAERQHVKRLRSFRRGP
jgi:rubrerythrin